MQPEDPLDPGSRDKEYMIACSSRALIQAESHYAPTEGERLAFVWATKKFTQYLMDTNSVCAQTMQLCNG